MGITSHRRRNDKAGKADPLFAERAVSFY